MLASDAAHWLNGLWLTLGQGLGLGPGPGNVDSASVLFFFFFLVVLQHVWNIFTLGSFL